MDKKFKLGSVCLFVCLQGWIIAVSAQINYFSSFPCVSPQL